MSKSLYSVLEVRHMVLKLKSKPVNPALEINHILQNVTFDQYLLFLNIKLMFLNVKNIFANVKHATVCPVLLN